MIAMLASRGKRHANSAAPIPVQSGNAPRDLAKGETSMKELVKQYLDQGISRRTLMANLSAAGLSAVAANTVAQALAPVSAQAAAASPGAVRDVSGTGGQLYLQQLKAAGV